MKELNDVYLGDQVVGFVRLKKEGMYYRIHCKCELPKPEKYTFLYEGEKGNIILGTYVPCDNGIFTRVRIRDLSPGRFVLMGVENREDEVLNSVNPLDDPYSLLVNLPNLRIKMVNNKMDLIIKNGDQQKQDSGQIQ